LTWNHGLRSEVLSDQLYNIRTEIKWTHNMPIAHVSSDIKSKRNARGWGQNFVLEAELEDLQFWPGLRRSRPLSPGQCGLIASHESWDVSCDEENGYKPWRGLQTTVMVTFPLLPSFWWHVPLFQKELCLIIFVFCNPVLYSFHACDKKGRKKAECELVSLAKIWSITRSVLQHLDRDQVNTEYAYCTSLVILNQGQTLEAEAKILFLRQSLRT